MNVEDLKNMPREAILALADKLLDAAKQRLASGQDVTQENIRITNDARKRIAAAKAK